MQVSKRKMNSNAALISFKNKHVEEILGEIKKKKSSEEDDVASAGKEAFEDHDYVVSFDGVEDDEEDEEDIERREDKTRVTYGFHMVRGKMDHGMEDYVVAETRRVDGKELGLYAIFDGHSGRDVAEYLQVNLFDNILNQEDFWTNPEMAMKRAYKSTDDEILDKVVGSRGGSTAVTAILIDGETLVVGNVGDSRGILCKRRVVKQITVDHEPKSSEKEAVERRGGFVTHKPTVEPNVRIEKIDVDSKFIVLASDGIWKVMDNEDVSECIEDVEDAQEAAEELVKMAVSRGSPDDISCVVVIFN